jgi:hypothetical protein
MTRAKEANVSRRVFPNPNLIVPVGTQIVTQVETKAAPGAFASVRPCGADGVIIEALADSHHAYRMRLTSGISPEAGHERG